MQKRQLIELLAVFVVLLATISVTVGLPQLVTPDPADTSQDQSSAQHPDSGAFIYPEQQSYALTLRTNVEKDSIGALKSEPPPITRSDRESMDVLLTTEMIHALKKSTNGSISIECPTPRSLMLHKHFGLDKMQSLADEINKRNLKTMTYREVQQELRNGRCPPSNAIIISIDDLSTAWIDPTLQRMIAVFTERDLKLVVGVVVRTPAAPEAWHYLQEIEKNGVEVASHTIDHLNLPTCTDSELEHQISDSYDLICEHLGRCPVSLIVPFGSMDTSGRIMRFSEDYAFVVGIANGLRIETQNPHYVGRISPGTQSLQATFQTLEVVFAHYSR